jgi:hypothetical protein
MPKEFNEVFNQKGGKFDWSASQKHHIWMMNFRDEINHVRHGIISPPNIIYDFVNNPLYQASAKKVEKTYYIGIYNGVARILESIFMRMLCSPNILPDYGNTSQEVNRPILMSEDPFGNAHLRNAERLSLAFDSDDAIPVDNERRTIARHLTSLALHFQFCHELGHIMNGHLKYVFGQGGEMDLNEVEELDNSTCNTSSLSPIQYQTLEYDADAFAASHSLGLLLQSYVYRDKIDNAIIRGLHVDIRRAYRLMRFAISTLFRLQGFANHDVNYVATSKYPAAGMRNFMTGATITTILLSGVNASKVLSPQQRNDLIYSIDTYSDVEQAFKEISIGGTGLFGIAAMQFALENQEVYCKEIDETWAKMRPSLLKHAYSSLPPAVA